MARRGARSRMITIAAVLALAVSVSALPAGAGESGETIKVMVIHEASAGVANPEIPDGAIAAAEAFNKKDGIGGSEVEVIVCDTNNDPNTAAECGRQAIDEGVVALIGVLTPHSGSFMTLMEENQIPSIGVVAAGVADFTSPASFPVTGGLPATAGDLPRFLADDGAERISIAHIDLAEAALIQTFADTTLGLVGQEVINDVPVPQGAPDMSSYVEAALANDTDGILVALSGQDAVNFVIAAKQAKPDVKLAVISTEPGAFQEALGADAAGIIQGLANLPPLTVKTAEGKRFLKELKKAGFDESSGFRLNSWLSMQVLKQVADDLPEVTGPAVFEALNASTGIETGLTPPLQWSTPADTGVDLITRVFNLCQLAVKLTKGTKVKPMTGTFFDAFADAECETPS